MKWYVVLVVVFCSALHAFAQDQIISAYYVDATTQDILDDISKRTGLPFTYVSESLSDQRVTRSWGKVTLSSLLTDLFEDTILAFDISADGVIVYPRRSIHSPFQIYGRVSDRESGEALTGANVYTDAYQGVIADNYGLYSLEINPDRDSLLYFRFLGFRTQAFPIATLLDGRKDIDLSLDNNVLAPITITVESNPRPDIPPQDIIQAKTYGAARSISGDRDVVEYLNAVPGITKLTEGKSGFSIHGSAPDQNLILLDDAPIFNPSHALGFISVFNNDVLNSATFFKTDISSKYGGRLSSVLDIRMREGNNKSVNAILTTNPFYSGITLEGPLVTERASFLISSRISHLNFALKRFDPIEGFYIPKEINFYDLHAKANYTLSKDHRIFISTFINNDRIEPHKSDNLLFYDTQWQNRTFTFRWNAIWGDKIFTNASYVFSDYEYEKLSDADNANLIYRDVSGIANTHIKFDINYHISKAHNLLAGLNYTTYRFEPAAGSFRSLIPSFEFIYDIDDRKSRELSLFLEDHIKIGTRAAINIGSRYSRFYDMGNNTFEYITNNAGTVIDSTFRPDGEVIRTFQNWEPRFSIDYQLHNDWLISGAFSRTSQYIFRLQNDNPTTPNEYWIPSGQLIKPQTSNIFSLTSHYQLSDYTRVSMGAFHRSADHVAAFKNGASVFFNDEQIDQLITQGEFTSTGIETSAEIKKENYRLYISYTFSDAKQHFEAINADQSFPAGNSFRNDFNLQASLDFSDNIEIFANWQLRSGDIITIPSGVGIVQGENVFIYRERNNYRLPTYHRLDISSRLRLFTKDALSIDANAGIFNVLGSRNPFQFQIEQDVSLPTVDLLSLYRTVPFLSLKFVYH